MYIYVCCVYLIKISQSIMHTFEDLFSLVEWSVNVRICLRHVCHVSWSVRWSLAHWVCELMCDSACSMLQLSRIGWTGWFKVVICGLVWIRLSPDKWTRDQLCYTSPSATPPLYRVARLEIRRGVTAAVQRLNG